MNGVWLEKTLIAFNQFAVETQVDAGVVESAILVSFSVDSPTVVYLDGTCVTPNRGAVVSPQRQTRIDRSAGSGVLLVRVSSQEIENRFHELTGRSLKKPLIFTPSFSTTQGVGAEIHRLLSHFVDDAATQATLFRHPILRTAFDDLLLNAILSLPHNQNETLRAESPTNPVPSLVRRAEEFLEAHAIEPMTMSDVVAECGCSRRTLYSAFQRHRGYTPMEFLAERRLQSAHQLLKTASSHDSVSQIALRCGFSHLGRFAAAYRERFGEKPSETLRKS